MIIIKKTAFLETILATNFRSGCQTLLQTVGVGNIRPNTAMFGYMESWKERSRADIDGYVGAIRDAFNFKLHVMNIRGIDHIDWTKKQLEGTIDVWWLIDDGGMTILIPFIISKAKFWQGPNGSTNNIRLFVIGDPSELETDKAQIKSLLASFRLDWEVHVISLDLKIKDETLLVYDEVISNKILNKQTHAEKSRTKKYLRISEAIQRESRRAKMVVMTIPFPRESVDSYVYMSWLEVLTKGFYVPCVLMRGNGKNVLTSKSE